MSHQAKTTLEDEYESLNCQRQGSLDSMDSKTVFSYMEEVYDGGEVDSKMIVSWTSNNLVSERRSSEVGGTLGALKELNLLKAVEPRDSGTNVYEERDPEETGYSERLRNGDGFDWTKIRQELNAL